MLRAAVVTFALFFSSQGGALENSNVELLWELVMDTMNGATSSMFPLSLMYENSTAAVRPPSVALRALSKYRLIVWCYTNSISLLSISLIHQILVITTVIPATDLLLYPLAFPATDTRPVLWINWNTD